MCGVEVCMHVQDDLVLPIQLVSNMEKALSSSTALWDAVYLKAVPHRNAFHSLHLEMHHL